MANEAIANLWLQKQLTASDKTDCGEIDTKVK